MRVLILNHVAADSIYGANQSLQKHVDAVRAHSDVEIHVINRIPIGGIGKSKAADSAYFPMNHNYEGAAIHKRLLALAYNSATSHRNLLIQITSLQPDVIHLNSLTLLPTAQLLKRDQKMRSAPIVASVREVFREDPSKSETAAISAIDMLVAIDSITRDRLVMALLAESQKRIRLCPNLFDVKPAKKARSRGATFALIGRVEHEKGARFVVNAFRQAAAPGAELKIIGGRTKDQYFTSRQGLPQGDGVLFAGQIANLVTSPSYADIDFIIRGEKRFHGLGRSGIEGLLAGKALLLPSPTGVTPTTDQTLRDLTDMGRIHWYRANDSSALSELIRKLAVFRPASDVGAVPVDSTLWFQDPKSYANVWADNYRDALQLPNPND